MTHSPADQLARARALLTSEHVGRCHSSFLGELVFPFETRIERRNEPREWFEGWPEDVLLLAREVQSVCSWGLSLGPRYGGTVVVGGCLHDNRRGTAVCCDSLEHFVAAWEWDSQLLEQPHLLTATACPLDGATLATLRRRGTELPQMSAWPTPHTYRFETQGVQILLLAGERQCDWHIAGATSNMTAVVPELLALGNLRTELCCARDDEDCETLLESVRARAANDEPPRRAHDAEHPLP